MDTIVEDILVPEGDKFFFSSFEHRPKINGQSDCLGECCGLGTVASHDQSWHTVNTVHETTVWVHNCFRAAPWGHYWGRTEDCFLGTGALFGMGSVQ